VQGAVGGSVAAGVEAVAVGFCRCWPGGGWLRREWRRPLRKFVAP
jgi:hypothetical protein